jgi:hypothetical protein
MGETSIPCREETRDRLDALRDGQYKSWDAFLNHLADVWEQRDEATAGEFAGLESLESSVETIEERTGRVERILESLQQ